VTALNILLVAEEAAGARLLRALSEIGHRVVAVATGSSVGSDRGANVAKLARQSDIPIWPAARVKESACAARLNELDVDVLLNVHSLYRIHPDVLAAARYGGFNLHPGPLPFYAGLNAPSWAIYDGRTRHAVSVHKMDAGIDTGPLVSEAWFEISPSDTGLTVSNNCVKHGLPLMLGLVDQLARDAGALAFRDLESAERVYHGREVPNGGRIDWQQPARRVVDFIRACDYWPFPSPWGHPRGVIDGRSVEVLKARRTHRPATRPPGTVSCYDTGQPVRVACSDEEIDVTHIVFEGRAVRAAEVLGHGADDSGHAQRTT
jgi:UDP-4-amino-4-deoxy-L-arabinose formyltransferase/UDP-glucuronic acid dehydrogenase (UDP-4-keto-hexauronic acid decarboxylating)